MELTNEQRKCLGLELVEPAWEREERPVDCSKTEIITEKNILFFDGDILRKAIWLYENGSFFENSYYLRTQNNRTMIAPVTAKGKPKRLSSANILCCTAYGMYAFFDGEYEKKGSFLLANYTTRQTYFSSRLAGLPDMNVGEFQHFLDKWVAETSEEDLIEIQAFAKANRTHCKYKEGDFFRFKYDRRTYGYGRILMDVRRFMKDGGKFWDILMGKPLCISIYHIVTENPNVQIADLQALDSCPSEYIMDNIFYYGEVEIIGNVPLPEEPDAVDYPIMYGAALSGPANMICYSRGKEYREILREGSELLQRDFRNNGIGFFLGVDKTLVEECIEAGSNEPYWTRDIKNGYSRDLRNPVHRNELEYVCRQMGV